MENTIFQNKNRTGNFTSSSIGALMTLNKKGDDFGSPALTYIAEKRMERRLRRNLSNESSARPTLWGKLLEGRCFDLLGIEYSLCSQQTIEHPEIPYWLGSPDGYKKTNGETTVIDIKCPYTMKSFCQLVDPLMDGLTGIDAINKVRENHKEGGTYFFQLISNAILMNAKWCELIIYCPFESELEDIRTLAENYDGADHYKYRFISESPIEEMPYLPDDSLYSNLNIIRFEVPEDDKILLTEKVKLAGKLLTL